MEEMSLIALEETAAENYTLLPFMCFVPDCFGVLIEEAGAYACTICGARYELVDEEITVGRRWIEEMVVEFLLDTDVVAATKIETVSLDGAGGIVVAVSSIKRIDSPPEEEDDECEDYC